MAVSHRGATWIVLVSAVFWGLWWIPVRWLEDAGLGGGAGALLMNAGGAAILGLFLLQRREGLAGLGWRGLAGAVAAGVAVTLYSTSILLTDVVRVVLLFYLAPAWSILIEVLFFGRRLGLVRSLPLILAAGGLVAITGGKFGEGGVNAGDLMALVSGLAWAIGAALLFTTRGVGAVGLSFAAMSGATVVSLALLPVVGGSLGAVSGATLGMGLATGAFFLAPILGLALWGAMRLAPALMSFLLCAEIVSGVVSSAVLLGEPFGLAEGVGAALILSAALVEALQTGEGTTEAAG